MVEVDFPAVYGLLGPTASGKSSLAIKLAERFNLEIISCDSMQVYRGLDIGVAKASAEELARIPHHLINNKDLHESYSAADFVSEAEQLCREIHARGKTPLLVGGTGLYAKLFFYGSEVLPTDKVLAAELKLRLESEGPEKLLEELAALDPNAAERCANNPRRAIRALEAVILLQAPLPLRAFNQKSRFPGKQFILMPEAKFANELISKRSAEMLEEGWIEECKQMMQQGLFESPTACQALGYKEIARFLQEEISREDLLELLIIRTRQYAKRQRTWFRNQHPGALLSPFEDKQGFDLAAEKISKDLEISLKH